MCGRDTEVVFTTISLLCSHSSSTSRLCSSAFNHRDDTTQQKVRLLLSSLASLRLPLSDKRGPAACFGTSSYRELRPRRLNNSTLMTAETTARRTEKGRAIWSITRTGE